MSSISNVWHRFWLFLTEMTDVILKETFGITSKIKLNPFLNVKFIRFWIENIQQKYSTEKNFNLIETWSMIPFLWTLWLVIYNNKQSNNNEMKKCTRISLFLLRSMSHLLYPVFVLLFYWSDTSKRSGFKSKMRQCISK